LRKRKIPDGRPWSTETPHCWDAFWSEEEEERIRSKGNLLIKLRWLS
jgi:hypothetical protein